jgi:hypothetical protein
VLAKKAAAKRQQRQLLKLVGVEIAEVTGHCSQCSSFLVMVDDDERWVLKSRLSGSGPALLC